jgi:hypothetical protein
MILSEKIGGHQVDVKEASQPPALEPMSFGACELGCLKGQDFGNSMEGSAGPHYAVFEVWRPVGPISSNWTTFAIYTGCYERWGVGSRQMTVAC